ncbi:MAG TPA: GNAT family N-acetyltransferase [Candidatus Acidoferrales bacterium]|nr:GNAT family N-acetyltransferase [Candidatus Acidoferrales bacterium]
MTRGPDYDDFNAFFRAGAFGNYDIFTARSYADFVKRNDIDLAHAIAVREEGRMLGALAFGVRGTRAWFGLIGVDPDRRREGLGARMLTNAIAAVQAQGVRTIELEVSQRNAAPVALCTGFGFKESGELLVWAREARSGDDALAAARRFPEPAVRAITPALSACWQREPRSIARAGPVHLLSIPGAYAFVRTGGEFASILDASAIDVPRARELLRELDARVPHDLTLNNEPANSALGQALRDGGWRVVERQYRMVRSL